MTLNRKEDTPKTIFVAMSGGVRGGLDEGGGPHGRRGDHVF